jgi:hypothetical protein
VLAEKQARGRWVRAQNTRLAVNSSSRKAIHWVAADMEQEGGTFKVKLGVCLLRRKKSHAGILYKWQILPIK